ncbi:GDP-L-fucose synthase family protein [Aurantibacter aestuarii]|uniref:GDP-L-fucose synthase n=1 Tax=Aurantibacter aestuarii TaxID=1266046 RepID=A0A2T1N5K4_9FLAO|nr:GDP-L-fucose synthase [Aurantibacter aestuarii]PSG86529.1 GDP-fucose synthetase [Aurantibacter aestuarii]
MKIFLTGNTGMVGKNILEHAKASEHTFLTPLRQDLNLEDKEAVNAYVKTHQPDLIIHAAGLVGGIQANMAHPVNFLVKNLDIGRNVIMAGQQNRVKQVLNLSSSCMYPRLAQNPLQEELILKGELEPTNEGYALAKIVSTRLCEYINSEDDFFQYKTIIPCNLYGRHDTFSPQHSHMIPAVIKKIHDAKITNDASVGIWGTGEARREFMFAEDLADFIFYALEHFSDLPQNTNVGLGKDWTINEYYQTIAKVIGYTGEFIHDTSKPTGMMQKLIDDTKLKAFGWQAQTSLEEGIAKTYEFYKNTVLND